MLALPSSNVLEPICNRKKTAADKPQQNLVQWRLVHPIESVMDRNIPATAWKKQAVNVELPDGFKVKIPCRKFGRNVHAAGTALRDVSFDWCCNCCFCCLLFLHMHYGMAFSIVVIVNCCHCQLLAFSIVVIVFSFTKMLFILPISDDFIVENVDLSKKCHCHFCYCCCCCGIRATSVVAKKPKLLIHVHQQLSKFL